MGLGRVSRTSGSEIGALECSLNVRFNAVCPTSKPKVDDLPNSTMQRHEQPETLKSDSGLLSSQLSNTLASQTKLLVWSAALASQPSPCQPYRSSQASRQLCCKRKRKHLAALPTWPCIQVLRVWSLPRREAMSAVSSPKPPRYYP